MSSVIMHPEDLEQFARELEHLNANLEHEMSRLRARLAVLGQTWRDPQYTHFAQEVEQTTVALRRFTEATNDFIPFLRRKAAAGRLARDGR